ncbi:MAG: helix-turn-helix domain-containing protein [Candidatus Aenigmarchaeota archaeon]|nr:helix-turn-helix domain-containing protein [Candidatus Aenigmarchaeota archaeon]
MLKILPQEVETWYIIPAIRREMAKEIIRRGLSQRGAAARLGITESAVSQYVKDKRANKVSLKPAVLDEIRKSVDAVMAGGSAFSEIYRLSLELKRNMSICDIHRAHDDVPQACNICYEAGAPIKMPAMRSD